MEIKGLVLMVYAA